MAVLVHGVMVACIKTHFFFQGYTVFLLPERYKDDAVDDVELFQDTGHTGSRKLGNGKKKNTI